MTPSAPAQNRRQNTGKAEQAINIVWLKRDLRLNDHAPLAAACEQPGDTLLLYIFEPSLVADAHYDLRHWRFIMQSINALNQRLQTYGTRVHVLWGEVVPIMQHLHHTHSIDAIFSHEETGIALTFSRDQSLSAYCRDTGIHWHEYPSNVVQRGRHNRNGWDADWQQHMQSPQWQADLTSATWRNIEDHYDRLPVAWLQPDTQFQVGGVDAAATTLQSFLHQRGKGYIYDISKPAQSRESCSRLSPYLAWGNLSLREVVQAQANTPAPYGWGRSMRAFRSRLHWQGHFIQKFESECRMEFAPVNPGYDDFPYRDDAKSDADLLAWQRGETGVPLIDACMRCLQATGYINFRMRAMLVSFLCHHLRIDWRRGVHHLARLFLDFEPGIHYPQFQMQAGVTGVNTIRIYNPIKQAQEQDPEGHFVRQWCPELRDLPEGLHFEPWRITPMEQVMLGCEVREPIIDVQFAAREARELLWSWRNRPPVRAARNAILQRHVRPQNCTDSRSAHGPS